MPSAIWLARIAASSPISPARASACCAVRAASSDRPSSVCAWASAAMWRASQRPRPGVVAGRSAWVSHSARSVGGTTRAIRHGAAPRKASAVARPRKSSRAAR